MDIKTGIDIIEVSRIKDNIESYGDKFLNRVFTKNEIEYCNSRNVQKYQSYAGRFAAKEAVFKALSENLDNKFDFKITNYTISDNSTYTYKSCNSDGTCPIYEKTVTAPSNKKIMHLKFDVKDKERDEFLNFINSYCKVRYVVDGQEKIIAIKNAVSVKYKGNHVYLVVPSEIENASNIDLLFTVRAYQYTYRLKGE